MNWEAYVAKLERDAYLEIVEARMLGNISAEQARGFVNLLTREAQYDTGRSGEGEGEATIEAMRGVLPHASAERDGCAKP